MANQLFRKKSIDVILRDAEQGYGDGHGTGLKKILGVRDLTFFGIAAIVGAGIITTFIHLARPIQEGFKIFNLQVPPLVGLIQILMAAMIFIVLMYKPEGLLGKNGIVSPGILKYKIKNIYFKL